VQLGVTLRIYFFGTSVDVTYATKASTLTYFGVADRRTSRQTIGSFPMLSCWQSLGSFPLLELPETA
jgi:hypothetical protein